MVLGGALRADAEKLQAVGNIAEAFFLEVFELAVQKARVDFGDLIALLAQKMMMVMMVIKVIKVIQTILGGVFAEKAFLHDIDFFKLMKSAIDCDQIALPWGLAFF